MDEAFEGWRMLSIKRVGEPTSVGMLLTGRVEYRVELSRQPHETWRHAYFSRAPLDPTHSPKATRQRDREILFEASEGRENVLRWRRLIDRWIEEANRETDRILEGADKTASPGPDSDADRAKLAIISGGLEPPGLRSGTFRQPSRSGDRG
jgi:hypothetical protein